MYLGKGLGRALKAGTYGGIVGRDFAGTVVEIGPDVSEGVRTVGERVAGFGISTAQPNGAFSEYLVADAEFGIVPIPDGCSPWPIDALQCLHQTLELPSPFEAKSGPQRTILIWGGASSVGQYAVQFAKFGGLRVLTTASPKNFDLVKGLGADEVFDYRDEKVVEKIRAMTGNALDIAQVTGAIGEKGGKVSIILPYTSPRPDVQAVFSYVPELVNRESNGKWYVELHKKIFATGKIKPNPVFIQPNGIAGVKDGLQYMQEGKVSAEKITYRVSDTPEI
ncbi:hypothetical protein BC826DRAFT_1025506 [Russula brevipes]|nr:hypothetical protein BC826DRAFT_1025506 [Russula brevipes]